MKQQNVFVKNVAGLLLLVDGNGVVFSNQAALTISSANGLPSEVTVKFLFDPNKLMIENKDG